MRRLAFSLLAVLAATVAFAPHASAWPGARPAAAVSAGNHQTVGYDGAFYVGNGLRAYYNPVYYRYGWGCGYRRYGCGGVYGYVPYPYAAYGYRYGYGYRGCGCPTYYYRSCGC